MKPTTTLLIPPTTQHQHVVERLRLAVYDENGATCPTCQQHAQVYRWNLYSTAASALILMYRLGGTTEFVHTNDLKALGHRGQGDTSRLRLWNLVEREIDRRPDGGRSGFWRVTHEGAAFVQGTFKIQKYAWVYAGRLLGLDGELIDIHEALGRRFNYDEMMGPR